MTITLQHTVFADFEASALRDGYPVEVGWAFVDGCDVHVFAMLISPADEWQTPAFVWDPIAEAIHGLSLANLQVEGMPPGIVCRDLNIALRDKIVVFDTGLDGVDRRWLDLLFAEGGQARSFMLGFSAGELLQDLAEERGIDKALQSKIAESAPPVSHRAAQDASHYAWRAAAIQLISEEPGATIGDAVSRIVVHGSVRV